MGKIEETESGKFRLEDGDGKFIANFKTYDNAKAKADELGIEIEEKDDRVRGLSRPVATRCCR